MYSSTLDLTAMFNCREAEIVNDLIVEKPTIPRANNPIKFDGKDYVNEYTGAY